MMLFPNKAHITHLTSADHGVQQTGIPLMYQKPKEAVSVQNHDENIYFYNKSHFW